MDAAIIEAPNFTKNKTYKHDLEMRKQKTSR